MTAFESRAVGPLPMLGLISKGKQLRTPITNPRWVLAPNVDSSAMLAAVMHFKSIDEERWRQMALQGQLKLVTHRSDYPAPQPSLMFRCIQCPDQLRCYRCSNNKGGYMFRWLSPLWVDKYEELAKPGAWKPGQQEGQLEPQQGEATTTSAKGQFTTTQSGQRGKPA